MNPIRNPFEYEAANNLSSDKIATYFVDDYNYSRFINSTRNVVMVGDRGCGKTMALIYNSLQVQLHLLPDVVPDRIGVYIPCKSVLMQKKEQELFDDPQFACILSEHFLTMSVLFHLVNDLSRIPNILDGCDVVALKAEIAFSLGFALPFGAGLLDSLRQIINKESREVQMQLNEPSSEWKFPSTRSFGTSILPLFDILRKIPKLTNAHFMLLFDDVHDLNDEQLRTINSWIAYRDHSIFSIKVASARIGQLHFKTTSGGMILEGHDFVQIDLEQPFHNEESNFGKLAYRLVSRRLEEAGIAKSPEDFFPVNETFEKELAQCRITVRQRASTLYDSDKSIDDYVYRFARAEWFRQRASHANLPAYSGFQTLVYLSTGVIRNLLEPCYWMFDDALSQSSNSNEILQIDSSLQRERIIDRSKKMWERLENLDRIVEGCSREDAKKIYSLFDQLAILFRKRLEKHESEPRAISFTISAMNSADEEELLPLLDVARSAQLLYLRGGPAKERGRREKYYVPNRMLWPVRGLDPNGQHARVSIRAEYLRMAMIGKPIPFEVKLSGSTSQLEQKELFRDES
ncbi:MAG: hypothetical protein SGI77_13955 [Pirellulaceae bacterium]|nr:hypothetical protein [Pirellulaceae bacterium]